MFLIIVLGILFVLICILLIFMVVITPSQEGGLISAFGGMGGDSFFGTRAHRQINRFTLFLAVAFLVLSVVISRMGAGEISDTENGGSGPTPTTPEPPPPGGNP